MPHSFQVYYKEKLYGLEELLFKLDEIGIHLNRIMIKVDSGIKKTISIQINPFLEKYLGLHISFVFEITDKYFNKLYAEDIDDLSEDYVYVQRCSLDFGDKLRVSEINNPHLEVIENMLKIFIPDDKTEYKLTYDNGHFKYLIDSNFIYGDKLKIKNFIQSKN